MVGEWALSGAPLASGGMQAWQSQIDATTEHPAGLGPWLPYSESKPAARARGGHPLKDFKKKQTRNPSGCSGAIFFL